MTMNFLEKLANQYRNDPLRRLALRAMATGQSLDEQDLYTLRHKNSEDVIAFAERNEIGPIVARSIRESDTEAVPGYDRWMRIYKASQQRMDVLMSTLDRVAHTFAQKEIPLVGLKNTGIARGIYDDPAACPMGDLDVLIPKTDFFEAHEALLGLGFELNSRSSIEPDDVDEMFASGGTEYCQKIDNEVVWFELQWRPVDGRWIRQDQEPAGDELIADAMAIPETDVLLLEPTSNLLQVALHTAKHTYMRAPGLRLHTDVDRIVTFTEPDWKQFVERVERLDVVTSVYFSLALARALLGTSIPQWVVERLTPPLWKRQIIARWLARCDIFEPREQKLSRPGILGFHALLYDDIAGLAASVFDTDKDHLTLQELPSNLRRGATRISDLLFRYEPS